MQLLKGKTVVLAVSGGIAAYKIPNLARMLIKQGARVQVVMTKMQHTLSHRLPFPRSPSKTVWWILSRNRFRIV